MLKIASKCYNRAHKHWCSRMEASFFIRGGGRRSATPSLGPASAWLPSTGAGGGVGASLARAPLSPDSDAASAGFAGGGSIGIVTVWANSIPWLTPQWRAVFQTDLNIALMIPPSPWSLHSREIQRNLHLQWLYQPSCWWNTKNWLLSAARGADDLLLPNSQHQESIKVS